MQDFSHTDKFSKLHSGSNLHQTATVLYTRLWCVFIMSEVKKISKSEAYKKLRFYSTEITKIKPTWDTVFRIYYDSLKLISDIFYHIDENPWHPENDYSYDIFMSINGKFEELEKLRLKSLGDS